MYLCVMIQSNLSPRVTMTFTLILRKNKIIKTRAGYGRRSAEIQMSGKIELKETRVKKTHTV